MVCEITRAYLHRAVAAPFTAVWGVSGIDNLGELTIANIEVVFKIYSISNEVESGKDSRFNRIVLASPLYVAID